MTGAKKLTPAQRAALERLNGAGDRGIMWIALLGSGGRARSIHNALMQAGYIEPHMVMLSREAVPGARITEAGRAMLAERAS